MRDMPNSGRLPEEKGLDAWPSALLSNGSLTRRRRSGWLSLRVDGFTLAIRGQSPCGESPADRGHRSQSFSPRDHRSRWCPCLQRGLHGDAAKTSSGVQSPEDTRTRWRFLGRGRFGFDSTLLVVRNVCNDWLIGTGAFPAMPGFGDSRWAVRLSTPSFQGCWSTSLPSNRSWTTTCAPT